MVFDFIPPDVEVWMWIGGIGGLITWMTHMAHCQRKSSQRAWRMEKAFISSIQLTAKLTKRAHPDEPDILEDVEEIEKQVNLILDKDNSEE